MRGVGCGVQGLVRIACRLNSTRRATSSAVNSSASEAAAAAAPSREPVALGLHGRRRSTRHEEVGVRASSGRTPRMRACAARSPWGTLLRSGFDAGS